MANNDPLKDRISFSPSPYGDNPGEELFPDVDPTVRSFLENVASCSPYLRRLMLRDPGRLSDILGGAPEDIVDEAARDLNAAIALDTADTQLKALRLAKDKASLTIALADIGGVWDVITAAARLSAFADAAVDAALAIALQKQKIDPAACASCGIAVIAMGKHGAFELNYSSDIDVIVIYDPDVMADPVAAKSIAVRATKDMVNLLNTQTADGYVFRTDLRLRPDPGVTAAALSLNAAESYYEAFGQNWERAAFIKARAAAGDKSVGERFLKALRPFVWRKYLDFAAIEDVKSVKRQIHATKGGGDIEFYGHDVKVGRGGIREIEFYAQTQQLILGGKNPDLRHRATLDALRALHESGAVTEAAEKDLARAYRFLRNVEHRVQMVNDEQTHKIPADDAGARRIAAFLGYEETAGFRADVEATLRKVHDHFADLFEYEQQLSSIEGSLIFTGVENHPETVATLQRMGFARASDVANTIRHWHASGVRATRTPRARELLTVMAPTLLEALAKAGDPDYAFFAFHDFLSNLPAGVQVFSLLANNPDVFNVLIRIMTISPFLGRELSRRHNFLEQLVESRWAEPPPAPETYGELLKEALPEGADYETALNAVRRWAGEERFQIMAQLVVGAMAPDRAGDQFTAIADAAIAALAPAAMAEMKATHGDIPGALVILGMGRVGAEEMTATSDVDLTFIYEAPDDARSNGAKPLSAGQYYARLVRRIVTALSAATEEGALYDVDMQLRPSGRAGPTAVSFAAFERYYREDAWTWEKMALVKARVLFGDDSLATKTKNEVKRILSSAALDANLAADVLGMREKLLAAKPGRSVWDVKNRRGGMTDVNFICQYLGLTHGGAIGPPPRKVRDALAFFAENGVLSPSYAERLKEVYARQDAILQISRAATGGVFDPQSAGLALKERMAGLCGVESINNAETILGDNQSEVAHIYSAVIK